VRNQQQQQQKKKMLLSNSLHSQIGKTDEACESSLGDRRDLVAR
jgi:hypothetical protein